MKLFFVILLILSALGYLAYKNKVKIKRYFILLQLKDRQKRRIKFDFDNEKQKRTIQMIERLIRDPNSQLEREESNTDETYYVACGDIYAVFNSRYASIVNGTFDNTTQMYDALFQNLKGKYKNRKRADVLRLKEAIDVKHKNILDFINENITERKNSEN